MSRGTIRYRDHKALHADYRNKRDMLGPQTAKNVWVNLQKLLAARGITVTDLSKHLGVPEGTLRAIGAGTLSAELMRRIKKWVASE